MQIKKYRNSIKLLIKKFPFQRLLREIIQKYNVAVLVDYPFHLGAWVAIGHLSIYFL
jgi:hypothetical protein